MQLSKLLAMLFLSGMLLPASLAVEEKNPIFIEERHAYTIIDVEKKRPKSFPDTLLTYTGRLSPGGKVYFYANRRDYAMALDLLNALPTGESGSGLYVRAFCLDGLGKSVEAIKFFEEAKAKIGSGFNPSLKFFLHWSTAQYHVGDYVGSLKNIEIAEKMHEKLGKPDENRQGTIPWTMLRRKACIAEKQKKFREAFEQYLSFFGPAKAQFNLEEPIKADPQIAARAKKWLSDHPNPPATKIPALLAKYSLTKGKAFIALGDFASAKSELQKVDAMKVVRLFDTDRVAARTPSTKSAQVRENTMVSVNPLTKTKDEARTILIRIYYQEKNFAKCCPLIRGTFFTDPMDSFSRYYAALKMSDVPELVTGKDISIHSKEMEERLDYGPYKVFVFDPDLKLLKQLVAQFKTDPLLSQALKEAQKGLYDSSYQTLERYTRKYAKADNSSLEDFEVTLMFRLNENYKFDLLQKGLALAAHRRDFILPFHNERRAGKSFWACVESYLLGNPVPPTKEQKVKADKMLTFDNWCHFAAGINGMYKHDFKKAAKEFALAGKTKLDDSNIVEYAKVLENYCASAK